MVLEGAVLCFILCILDIHESFPARFRGSRLTIQQIDQACFADLMYERSTAFIFVW